MYASRENILYFITENNSLKTVECMINNNYTKTIIDNDILELSISISCTSDNKLLVNTIDSETHLLNLNDNTCKRMLSVDNIDGTPAKIMQCFTISHATLMLIHTQKFINIERPSYTRAIVDLQLEHDEIIISARFIPGNLIVFTNLNTKILDYNIGNNTCSTKNETIKIIQKKYYNAYLLDTHILFLGNNTVDIYENNFIDNCEILSDIEIKNQILLNRCIYILGKIDNHWMLYCCSADQQEKNDTVVTMNKKNYYLCKIFEKLCEEIDIYKSCRYHGYIRCTCALKYILVVHDTTNIEFIDMVSKIVTSYKMEYQVKFAIIISCNNLVVVTNSNDLKYYEIMQDIDDKFIMNYRGEDEHRLKINHKYSKKALHHL